LLHGGDRGLPRIGLPPSSWTFSTLPFGRNGYLQTYDAADVEPLQSLRIFRLDAGDHPPFNGASAIRDGECLYAVHTSLSAHVPDGAFFFQPRKPRPQRLSQVPWAWNLDL